MSYPSKKLPFSVTVLAIAVACVNSSYIHASPTLSNSDSSGGIIGIDGNTTNINISHVNNTEMVWDTFNIASDESVIFNQMNSDSVVVNQINDLSASQILGTIKANGHCFFS
ncbi:two-partner secretion domain-containing protein [Pseudomonas sp. HK3]